MEREGVLIQLNVSALGVRDQNASGAPVKQKLLANRMNEGSIYLPFRGKLKLLHGTEILGAASGR